MEGWPPAHDVAEVIVGVVGETVLGLVLLRHVESPFETVAWQLQWQVTFVGRESSGGSCAVANEAVGPRTVDSLFGLLRLDVWLVKPHLEVLGSELELHTLLA